MVFPTHILKLALPVILPALTHTINLSLTQGVFPSVWKHAKVTPLLKPGKEAIVKSSYRPVSQLMSLSKVLEKIVFNQLSEYLEENKLIHPNHHGGRRGHNTATAMAQMYDQWVEEVKEGKMVGLMMFDQSSVFDMVEVRSILMEKLQLLGLDMTALKWMESFSTDRKQSVCIDGKLSPALDLEQGLAQGSILAPLRYVLFTCERRQ